MMQLAKVMLVAVGTVGVTSACSSSNDASTPGDPDPGAHGGSDSGITSGADGGTGGSGSEGGTTGDDGGNASGDDASSAGGDAGPQDNLVMYANGVVDLTDWPTADDYSFGGTDSYKDTAHPQAGHAYDLSLSGSAYAGWQQASDWALPYQGGHNGVNLAPYTQLQFDVYLTHDNDLNSIAAHYTRSTGDDVATCTGVTDVQQLTGSLSSGTWHDGIRIPLAYLGMMSSYNTYKFSIQDKTGPIYFDNVQFVAGTTGWVVAGTGALESGWVDASVSLTANYAWVPQSLNPGGTFDAHSTSGLFAINNPRQAAEFTGALSGTTLTVSALSAGAVYVGQFLFGNGVADGTTIVSGSGSTWTVSAASANVGAEPMTAGFTQAQIDGLALSGSGTWRASYAKGFSLAAYSDFTFGALPTAAGYSYAVQFYNVSGAAVGSAVNAVGSAYTPNDYGVQNASFTVYSIPLSAFGAIGGTIGGVGITVNQKTYLSAIGFWK